MTHTEIVKKIIVMLAEGDYNETGYEKLMIVVYSNHERFSKGTRFDFGFLQIASNEGYIIEILP